MRYIILSLLLLPSLVSSASLSTLYTHTVSLGKGMSMTIQIKESDGQVDIPVHSHPLPGVVYLIKGEVDVDIQGQVQTFYQGENWIEPALIPHQGASRESIRYFAVYHHPTGKPFIIK